MRTLITGGAGFIGSCFIRMISKGLFSEISSVIIFDKLTYAGNMNNIAIPTSTNGFRFIEGDICDFEEVKEILSDVDVVINFAAESHVDRSIFSSNQFIQTNVVGVQRLLDTCKTVNPEIRFVQISTDEVYGSIQYGASREDFPMNPSSPYAASKAGGELLARSYFVTHGMDIVITRSSNNLGPFQFPEKLIPLFITNILEGKKLTLYGNGANLRDWLHVEDNCRGIYAVLTSGKAGGVYNIGGGQVLSNLEIAKRILGAMGEDEKSIEYVQDRKGHDFRYSVDWTKIERELGYSPQIPFNQGLMETIDWYTNNQSWWKPLKSK